LPQKRPTTADGYFFLPAADLAAMAALFWALALLFLVASGRTSSGWLSGIYRP